MKSGIWGKLAELLYPSDIYCISCGHPLEAGRPYSLCGLCREEFSFAEGKVCAFCGRPLPERLSGSSLCRRCAAERPPFQKGYVCTSYNLWEKETLYRFKYGNRAYYGDKLAEMMYDMLVMRGAGPYDLIVPVPVHKTRLAQRGYNQAALLAEGLGKRMGVPAEPLALQRSRSTAAMKTMSRAERKENVKNAFRPGPVPVEGKHILLVDDILTTGSTGEACSRVLLEAGASSVELAVFSAVPDGGIAQVCG
ncbi:MAG: ComF family protein [Firmicutes bacterium]|nr:ComF family protein [Bacillota bacterium]